MPIKLKTVLECTGKIKVCDADTFKRVRKGDVVELSVEMVAPERNSNDAAKATYIKVRNVTRGEESLNSLTRVCVALARFKWKELT